MKKHPVLWTCLGLLLVLMAGSVYLVLRYVNSGYLAQRMTEICEKQLNAPIVFTNEPKIKIFPLSLVLGQLSWHGNIAGKDTSVVIAGGKVIPQLSSLLSGHLVVEELMLEQPEITILPEIAPRQPQSHAERSLPGVQSRSETAVAPEIERLVVRDGKIHLKYENNIMEIDGLNALIDNIRPRQESDVQLDFALKIPSVDAQGQNRPDIEGNFAMSAMTRYYAPNLTLRNVAATFTALRQSGLEGWSPIQARFEGALNMQNGFARITTASIELPFGELQVKGEGKLNDNFIGEALLKIYAADNNAAQAAISVKSDLQVTEKDIDMANATVQLGETAGDARINIKFPSADRAAKVVGEITLGLINIPDFIDCLYGRQPQEQSAAGATDGDRRLFSGLPKGFGLPDMNLKIYSDGLKIKKFLLEKIDMALSGVNGRYQIEKASCQWADGKMDASGHADMTSGDYAISADGKDIMLAEALAQFEIPDLRGGVSEFHMDMDSSGYGWEELAGNLSGSGYLASRNLDIAPMHALGSLLPILGLKQRDALAVAQNIRMEFTAKNGQIHVMPMRITGIGLNINGQADINLPRAELDGKAEIDILGFQLPVTFRGPFTDVHMGIGAH